MPKLDLQEIRGLSEAELRTRADELREEQFRLRFRSATETLEEPLRLRSVRRDIARVLTVLREKQLGTNAAATNAAATKKAATKKTAAKKSASKTTATKKSATASEGTAKRAASKRTTKTAR